MKKVLLIIATIVVLPIFVLYWQSRVNEREICDVLPKNINYQVVLDKGLFKLTEHGLVAQGNYVDFNKWNGDVIGTTLDAKNKIIYFYTSAYSVDKSLFGIYKLDLTAKSRVPVFIEKTQYGEKPTISPNGKYLTYYVIPDRFSEEYPLMVMNLETHEVSQVEEKSYTYSKPVWINSRQFVHYSARDDTLFLFDVITKERKDLHMRRVPGSLVPDGGHLFLSSQGGGVLYNIATETIDDIIPYTGFDINKTVWMPDGRGFLYYDHPSADIFSIPIREIGGIAYYSLDSKKSVRLFRGYFFEGGFVVPPDMVIKPVNTMYSKKKARQIEHIPGTLKKVCLPVDEQ